jgi:hypothetical protein
VSTPGSEQSRQHDLPLPKVPKEAILVSQNPEYRGMVCKLIASKRGLLGLKRAGKDPQHDPSVGAQY